MQPLNLKQKVSLLYSKFLRQPLKPIILRFIDIRPTRISSKGSIAILTVFVIAALLMIAINVQEQLQVNKSQSFFKNFNEFALESATKSGFKLMEAALRRRLWEMPPDSDCNKSESVKLETAVTPYLNVVVTANFDSINKLITLTSKGTDTRNGEDLTLIKVFKVFDASDYLLYSKGDEANPADNKPMKLDRAGSNSTAAILAGSRKIYSENPLILGNVYFKPSSWATGVSSPSTSPPHDFLGTIIQGERMTLAGGIKYGINGGNPFSHYSQSIPTYIKERGEALGVELYPKPSEYGAVITPDITVAQQMVQSVQSDGGTSFPPSVDYINRIYPFSLFCGTPPLIAEDGIDDGCFNNSMNARYTNKYTSDMYSELRELDLYCASAAHKVGKSCSSSTDFPKGFEQWKQNADLENILYSEAQEKLELEALNWDNLNALKEDAQMCGQYISAHTSSYEDCDVADRNFLNRYANNPSESCNRFSRVEINPNSFPKFNASFYANPANKEQWFRRVIYSEVPIEISQQGKPNGLASSLANNNARKNMPLWIVSPDVIRLKPHQQDTSSPTISDPSRQRETFFNMPYIDSINTEPLKMVLLSPEVINVVSPFHQPMTKAQLTSIYPVSGGKIKPRLHVYTDYIHQEEDGFKYGARTLNFKHLIIISNKNPNTSLALTGLWHGYERLFNEQIMAGFCMLSDPFSSEAAFEITSLYGGTYIPLSGASTPPYTPNPATPAIPPGGSKFYGSPLTFHPYVFSRQYSSDRNTSQINFEGLRIFVGFSKSDPPLRDISSPSRSRGHQIVLNKDKIDLSDRHYIFNADQIYQKDAASRPCTSLYLKNGEPRYTETQIVFSAGRHSFAQAPIDQDFKEAGNFNAKEMITIKVRD